jgi:hypothetical protein
MAGHVPRYARRLVTEFRNEVHATNALKSPAVDSAHVITIKPKITLELTGSGIVYTEDEVLWNFDPDELKKGDTVTVAHDSDSNPAVLGHHSGLNHDPMHHPEWKKFHKDTQKHRKETASWRKPVKRRVDLPRRGNGIGDIRLVTSTGILYIWNTPENKWEQVVNDVDPTKLPLTGGTITGALTVNSKTNLSGGLRLSTVLVSANYAVNLTTDNIILANSSGGGFNVTLPATHVLGDIITVKDSGGLAGTLANNIIVDTAGADTIDGAAIYTINVNYRAAQFVSNGTNWFVISNYN